MFWAGSNDSCNVNQRQSTSTRNQNYKYPLQESVSKTCHFLNIHVKLTQRTTFSLWPDTTKTCSVRALIDDVWCTVYTNINWRLAWWHDNGMISHSEWRRMKCLNVCGRPSTMMGNQKWQGNKWSIAWSLMILTLHAYLKSLFTTLGCQASLPLEKLVQEELIEDDDYIPREQICH